VDACVLGRTRIQSLMPAAETPVAKEMHPMTRSKMLGFVLLAVGIVLLVLAWQGSNAPADQITEALTGSYTDRTNWFLIGGIAASVGGGLLLVFGMRGK
tara:strand:+ start:23343 stop:23639 length:297 start_codon:yes stop_codon:yes gene_type:complete